MSSFLVSKRKTVLTMSSLFYCMGMAGLLGAQLFVPSLAYAEVPSAVLDEIVITGSREATPLKQTPAPITKIKPALFQERAPTFIGEVLNTVPGVYVNDLANEQHMVSLRQPITTQATTLYLEDGIPIRPVGLFNHNQLYEMNLNGIDSIEVTKGPASSLYGNNAVGGAVNMMSKASTKEAFANLGTQASNQGNRRIEFDMATGKNEGRGTRLSGYLSDRQGGWQTHNDADKQSLTIRHDRILDDRTTLTVVGDYSRLHTEMPGSLKPSDYQNNPGVSPYTFTWREVEAYRLRSTWDRNWDAKNKSTVSVYARHNITDQLPSYFISNINANTAKGRIVEADYYSWGMDAKHRVDLATTTPIRLIFGVVSENTPFNAKETNLAITRSGRLYTDYTVGAVLRDYSVSVSQFAGYWQGEWTVLPQLTLTGGVRHDHIQYKHTNNLEVKADGSNGFASGVTQYHHLSPKLGFIWSPIQALQVYGNASEGFAPPEVSAQYGGSNGSVSATPLVLKDQTYRNVDLGLRWGAKTSPVKLELTAYRLTGKDEIVSFSTAPGKSESRNSGETTHYGIEFGANWKITPEWQWNLNTTLAKHRFDKYQVSSTLNFDGKEMPKAPSRLVNTEIKWMPNERFTLGTEMQHLGHYWMNNANTVRYGGHNVFNIRAKAQVNAHWDVWLNVLNALDKRYAETADSTFGNKAEPIDAEAQNTYSVGAPRTIWVGARYWFGASRQP